MGKRAIGLAGVLGLVVAVGVAGSGFAASQHKRTLTDTAVGAAIILHGTSFQTVYKQTTNLDGNGASVQTGTTSGTAFPLSGTDTDIAYYANGVSKTADKFKLSAPNAQGISTIAGSGKCVGGTGIHQHEKCSYTFTGTYDIKTTVTKVKATGTDSR